MNQKALNTVMIIACAGLGAAGLILILISIFTEKDTLKWGMLCVALGSILGFIRMLKKKTHTDPYAFPHIQCSGNPEDTSLMENTNLHA